MSILERILGSTVQKRSAKSKNKIRVLVNTLQYGDLCEAYADMGKQLCSRNLGKYPENGNLMGYTYSELVDAFETLADLLGLQIGIGELICKRFLFQYSQLMSSGCGHILESEQAYSILVLVLDTLGVIGDYDILMSFLSNTFFSFKGI